MLLSVFTPREKTQNANAVYLAADFKTWHCFLFLVIVLLVEKKVIVTLLLEDFALFMC